MATYKHYYEIIDIPTNAAEERLAVEEFDIYGSHRLGTLNKEVLVAYRVGVYTGGTFIPGIPDTYTIAGPLDFELANEQVGYKNYELSNHLGNVLATITDRKVPFVNGSSYDYFNAQIVSMTDYYPFGMQIEERSWTAPSNKYRFGFNGKENDKEGMGGGQSTYDYGFRIYNPALARFLSVDPLTASYPWYTPYQFAGNSPIKFIDIDGLEPGYEDPATGQMVSACDNVRVNVGTSGNTTLTGNGFANNAKLPIGVTPHKTVLDKLVTGAAMVLIGGTLEAINEIVTGYDGEGEEGNRFTASLEVGFDLLGGKLIGLAGKGGKSLYKWLGGLIDEAKDTKQAIKAIKLGSETADDVLKNSSRLNHAWTSGADKINKFKGKKWNSTTEKEFREFNKDILENPDATFNAYLRGDQEVLGFYKKVDGQDIITFVYKDGDKAGQLATTAIAQPGQLATYGVTPTP